ncbi:MAG: hypothetical protein J6W37_07510 [Bacteroidales bacterium]|nr:hypothetical protein [Bacteroidales bacterium]
MRKLILLGFICFLGLRTFAQEDTDTLIALQEVTKETADSIEKKHSPKTAAILSTILPGAGQIYNNSWWKVPIVYAGFAGIGYGLYFYQDYYKSFKTAYNNYRNPYLEQGLNPPADTILTVRGETGYSPVNVQQGRDFYRKYRDLCIIGLGVWYLANILDAYTEAHLFEFDVSDDLSVQWQPTFYYRQTSMATAALPSGIKFTVDF